MLGLAPAPDGIAAWEGAELVLVTAQVRTALGRLMTDPRYAAQASAAARRIAASEPDRTAGEALECTACS